MRLYLAGPMSGITDWNYPLFHAEAARLRELGFAVYSPAEINAGREGDGWEACMARDLRVLVGPEVHGIALLPQWEESRGARLEHHVAVQLRKRVFVAVELLEFEDAERRNPKRLSP